MDPFSNAFLALSAIEPGAAACVSPADVRTRGELSAQMQSSAAGLARAGVRSGTLVALCAPPGPAFVAAWLALRSLDACALLMDPGAAAPERERVLQHLGAGFSWSIGDGWDAAPLPGELEARGPASPACMQGISTLKLTSGSTGLPCGVAVRAEELLADGRNLVSTMGLTGADRMLCTIPFTHSYGFSVLPTPLCLLGACLILPEGEDALEVASRFGATVLPSVPAWYQARLRLRSDWPASLRLHISAGAPLSADTAREFRQRTGRPIHAFYGSSECGGITFDRAGGAAERGTVGTPVDNVRVDLRPDPDDAAPACGASLGLVRVRSAAVASGYYRADPARAGQLAAGQFYSEDLARFEGGELALRGRRSEWINVKGIKVDPREIEQVLAGMPGVREVAVVAGALPGGRGEAVRAIIACEAQTLRYQEVVAWCRARLAAHKVPRSVVLVCELPRNDRGKLDLTGLEVS